MSDVQLTAPDARQQPAEIPRTEPEAGTIRVLGVPNADTFPPVSPAQRRHCRLRRHCACS